MKPNRRSRQLSRGASLLEVMVGVLVMAGIFLALFNLQMGSDRSLVKAGEFMVASAVLANSAQLYKIKPFDLIADEVVRYDEFGRENPAGSPAFVVRAAVRRTVMPNQWAVCKRIILEVEKPGTFFGTTLLKTALLRVDWNREP